MRGKKVNSMVALFLILLVFGVLFAYLVGAGNDPVTETFEFVPQTLKDLKSLNQTLSGTSSQGLLD